MNQYDMTNLLQQHVFLILATKFSMHVFSGPEVLLKDYYSLTPISAVQTSVDAFIC